MFIHILLLIRLIFHCRSGCCYNSDCECSYHAEDQCFMEAVYGNAQEGFCYGGNCIPWVGSEGTCQCKNSRNEGCKNSGANPDDNYCVTGLCSDSTAKCSYRADQTYCIPTTEPSSVPTGDPSYAPSNSPTTPTSPPTDDPIGAPSNSPTAPTVEPTIDPSHDPTKDPTTDPTKHPTNDPTKDPTIDPTTNPTYDPTTEPTVDPTKVPTAPTKDPTMDPTMDPTRDPSVNPTHDPTSMPSTSPTSAPTMSPLSFAEILEMNVDDTSSTQEDVAVYVGIGSVAVFVLLLALIIQRSDDQDYEAVALYMLQCFDLYSDVLLAVVLYKYYLSAVSVNVADINQQKTSFLEILCWVCALSAIVPYFLNIFTAITIISKISREKNIPSFTKDYLGSHTSVYALGVLLNGGSYTTLALLNSKLFNLPIFNSGLSSYKLREFEHFKIINTVILENTPQLIIQGLALYTFGSDAYAIFGATIWASFVTSLLSIMLSIMVWCLRRTGNDDYFRMSLQISVMDDAGNMKHKINGIEIEDDILNADAYDGNLYFQRMISNSKYRKKLGGRMAHYFGITPSNIQILSAYKLQNNLNVNVIFRCNKHESHKFDPQKLETIAERVEFVELLQNVYDIDGALLEIEITVFEVDDKQDDGLSVDAVNNHQKQIEMNVTANTAQTSTNKKSGKALLNEWGLSQYWNVLRQNGFEDITTWKMLDSRLLEGYGFKMGHIFQFKEKYKEVFEKQMEGECNIEADKWKEGDGALPDDKSTEIKSDKMYKTLQKKQSFDSDNEGKVDELIHLALQFEESIDIGTTTDDESINTKTDKTYKIKSYSHETQQHDGNALPETQHGEDTVDELVNLVLEIEDSVEIGTANDFL